jgi:hypothetical protein
MIPLSYGSLGSLTYGYDADGDGDITCVGGNICPNEFSYDSHGHLQQWAANPYTIDYSYDAFGRRTERNDGGILINYYQYDGLNSVAITNLAGVINLLDGMGLEDLYFWSNNEGTPNPSCATALIPPSR